MPLTCMHATDQPAMQHYSRAVPNNNFSALSSLGVCKISRHCMREDRRTHIDAIHGLMDFDVIHTQFKAASYCASRHMKNGRDMGKYQ